MKKFFFLFVAMIASFATNAVADGLKSGGHYSILDGNKNAYWSPSNKANSKYSSSSTPSYFDVTVDGDKVTLKDQNGYYVGVGTDKYAYTKSESFQWTLAAVEGSEGVYTLYQESVSGYTGYAGFTSSSKSVYLNNSSAVNLTFTPALKVTYKFVDGEGTSVGNDQVGFVLAGAAYPTVTAPTGYKAVSGAPAEGATVADATAEDETYTIVCAVDNIEWTVAITGAPEGSEPTIKVGENSYSNGETFTYSSALTAADVTASTIDGYLSKVAVSHTETTGTVSATYYKDMTPSLPEGYVLKMGTEVAATMTPATGANDNDHWYVLTQTRGTETMAYNNGTSTMKRDASATAASIDGKAIADNLKYIVRFLPTSYDGVYNMQFADGKFIQTTLVTGAQDTAGMYFFYNINGEDGNYGWNLTEDGTTYGSIVDNNGAGEKLSFWESGQVTYTTGNNCWFIYTAEFVEPSPAVELTASATTAIVNNEITLTATATTFDSDPTIAISYTKDGGEAVALDGTTFTPTEAGKYVFTATATGTHKEAAAVATSKPVTVNVMSDKYAGTWLLLNNDENLYATYGTGRYGSEANLGETATEVTFSIVNGAYNIQFVGQSKWLGQNSWDSQCYSDGPQTAYTIEDVEGGIQIMTGSKYLTYAWDNSYSVNNIVWGTTASTWSLEKVPAQVTLAASATEVAPGTEITLTATTKYFDATPTIAYSVAIDGAEATALEGNTYTPAADGTYVFTATATAGDQSATSNAVTVNVASMSQADVDLAATLAGEWLENTTGQECAVSADWTAFTIKDGAVTITANENKITVAGLLGDASSSITGTVKASTNTITFEKGQTIYYGGYDWTLTYDPDAASTEANLVATINADGSISLDGLNIMYSGSSYMYNVVCTLTTKPNPADVELAATLAGEWFENTTGQECAASNDWTAFTITDGAVTATADGKTVTFTGLLGVAGNALKATVNSTDNTLTFAKGQTVSYGGYNWELCYDPTGYATEEADLVATINADGSISLDGLSVWYSGYSYMYDVVCTLSRSTAGISSATDAYTTTLSNGKYIQNGRVVIVKNGRKYNVAGQIVK